MKPVHPKATPPRPAAWLLRRLHPGETLEEVQGDLEELYAHWFARYGKRRADLRYGLAVLSVLPPLVRRRRPNRDSYPQTTSAPFTMFRHHLLLVLRNFKRSGSTVLINQLGLSTGLAGALLIVLWVGDELRFDTFHANDARLYQVLYNFPLGDGSLQTFDNTQGLLAGALAAEMPEVEGAAAVMFRPPRVVAFGDTRVKATGQYVGGDYLRMFSWEFIQGNPQQVLRDKRSVAISDELARKLFGTTENAVGKTVAWEGGEFSGPYRVSGVFRKPPRHSTAQFDLLLSYQLFLDKDPANFGNWGNTNPFTYLLLKEGTDPERFNARLRDFARAKFKATQGTKDLASVGTLFVQRYSDKYLHNHYENGVVAGGRITYVRLLSVVAAFILVIAAINFMNLSTAKASTRQKEIGVKKAMGADRRSLVGQFLLEAQLMAFVALGVALVLVALLLPQFNLLTGKALSLSFSPPVGLTAVALTGFTGLLAGSYPALYLSGLHPITVLKSRLRPSGGEAWVRKGLVVFQFAVSIVLIAAVLVVYRQIDFIQSKHLGLEKDNVIRFTRTGRLGNGLGPFLEGVKALPGVVHASSMGGNLTGDHSTSEYFDWEGKSPDQRILFNILFGNFGLTETLGIEMAAGRSFSRAFGTDSAGAIFNEAAISAMGLKDPLGKTVSLWGGHFRIVGIAKNFHFESLYEPVKPVCILNVPDWTSQVMVKMAPGREREAVAQVERFYRSYNQGLAFEYTFLDQEYQALYAAEGRVSVLSRYFAGIAGLISFLGLFGLASFTAEQRRKEIGVRKVLGASTGNLVGLLARDFLKLVGIAILVATPFAWWAGRQWLQSFAYRVDPEWWVFGLSGLGALVIAMLSVGYQSIRAARQNPVKSLRTE